uniref:ATP synthase F0 subunit 8 n=1 Tax=Scaphidium formosanum TaxID=2828454 RepID=UPI001BEDE8F1|nr:ATP synthase F0 subunit 8 [Scaphidium formosanum]QTZ18648.1 ATP synthase F0 subunit 8 [Scaphidium formosanum]
MPQMMPLNWMTLFLFFTLVFLIFNSQNYFLFYYSPTSKTSTKSSNSINWKW